VAGSIVDITEKELQCAQKVSAQFFDAAQNAGLVDDAVSAFIAADPGAWGQRNPCHNIFPNNSLATGDHTYTFGL
jgi:hypothetical protein